MGKSILASLLLFSLAFNLQAKELAGVTVADRITRENNETLLLNGMGLREKFWLDIYVGSLYLVNTSHNVAEILSRPDAFRIQLDFIYKEVTREKLQAAWKEGIEKNQSRQTQQALQSEIEQFYALFTESAFKSDRYIIDYSPDTGTSVTRNDRLLGTIRGKEFRNALLEIWLGNHPADKKLKKGMLGLD